MKRINRSQRRIFLDHASTTPLDPRVLKAMLPYLKSEWGNPSALYEEGVSAKRAVAGARTSIARLLNVRSEEIIFTASGTEADNLAILGVFNAWKHFKPHIITTNIEHPGILEACRRIESEGGEVTYVPVEENGIVDPKKIKAALRPNTVLVSVMYANNEIGTIQPLRDISRVIQEFKSAKQGDTAFSSRWPNPAQPQLKENAVSPGKHFLPYFHTDASQAPNYLTLNFQALGVDMMTVDASKVYGPKGVGFLAAKRAAVIQPLTVGGGQEKGLRSGTENVAGIIGLTEALTIADKVKEKESERLLALRNYFFEKIKQIIPEATVNGDLGERLPNNINICIPGLDAEFAVIKLDQLGIACSSASSCLNLSENSYSYVVESLGDAGKACRESSLRFTLGRGTKKSDIDYLLRNLPKITK